MNSRLALIAASLYTGIFAYEFNTKLDPGTKWVYDVSQQLEGSDIPKGEYERTITLQSMNPDSIHVFRFNIRDSGVGQFRTWDSTAYNYFSVSRTFDTTYTTECFVGSQDLLYPGKKWGDLSFVFSKDSFSGNVDSVVAFKNGFEKYIKADTLEAFYLNNNIENRFGTVDIRELYAIKDVGIIFRKFTFASRLGDMYSIWELKQYNNKPVNSAAIVNKIDLLIEKPVKVLSTEIKVNESKGTRISLIKDRIGILYEGRLLDFLGRIR